MAQRLAQAGGGGGKGDQDLAEIGGQQKASSGNLSI